MREGNCVGKAPNLRENPQARDFWFPAKGESPNDGKIACYTCPVRPQCDEYRVRTGSDYGMWAGVIQGRD